MGRASGRPLSIPQSRRTPFAYTTDLARLLTRQLTKFTTLNRHQLAGQVANLDFWLAEARHCLDVLDGYQGRFERMKAAEAAYVAAHDTREFQLNDRHYGHRDITRTVSQSRRTSDAQRTQARHELCEACYRFLLRCFREGQLDESRLRQACEPLGVGVESRDLTSPAPQQP